ncbi:unnamed protein product [Cylicocyclus nassatus]|uniref:Uncharacterized protein n=1 Tax=Cylicocyclus nassatus TaxID=53992 RepID=A0AA36H5R1_CYLNA|nr:unnamed protein product [Cylicocyclus nassatus]
MSLRATLVILVVAVLVALCQSLAHEENDIPPEYGNLENYFYGSPRSRGVLFDCILWSIHQCSPSTDLPCASCCVY